MSKKYWLKKENKSDEFDYIDQDGVSYNSPMEWLWSELGGCGCGSSDEFAVMAYKVLELFSFSGDDWDKRTWSVYDKPEHEIIAHWLAHEEFIEHGTSIGGSWLSEKGKQFYENIKSLTNHQAKEIKRLKGER